MQIVAYKNFIKRKNSTKQPTGGDMIEVSLKDSTSIESPTFLLSGDNFDYNYVNAFGHYYYVSDINSVRRGLTEIRCTQDVLATYKSDISNTTAYIQYSASDFNKLIPDARLSVTGDTQISANRVKSSVLDTGTYIIAIAGKDGTATSKALSGMVCYYAVSAQTIQNLTDDLYTDSIAEQIRNYFKSPFDALISAQWVPFAVAGGEATAIYMGNYLTTYTGTTLGQYAGDLQGETLTINIPWFYDDWRNLAPFTQVELWLPFYGALELPIEKLITNDSFNDSIRIDISTDPISGTITYGIICGYYVTTVTCACGVTLAIGQTVTGAVKGLGEIGAGITAIAGAGLSVATGGASIPVAMSAVGGVTSIGLGAITAQWSQSNGAKGSQGNYSVANLLREYTAYGDIKVTVYSHVLSTDSPDSINSLEGKPLYNVRKIGNLTGYVRCQGASVSMAGLDSDKDIVNEYLNSGFYFE